MGARWVTLTASCIQWLSVASWRMAPAKKRKFFTARGMSMMRAAPYGLPASSLSMRASRSKCSWRRSAILSRYAARISNDVAAHAGYAAFAAATARATSAASLRAI